MRVSKSLCFAACVSLGACGLGTSGGALDTRQNAGPCPTVGALYDTARIIKFDGPEGTEVYSDIAYTGEIVDVRLFCRYVGDEPLLAEVEVDFAFGQGPKGAGRYHEYSYFVAVTRRNARVLSRESFSVRADFRNGPVDAARDVVGKIQIPRIDETISGANFEILVGFDLTNEQLAFNRDGKRFRLDAGERAG
ncbi:MAG: hypothetical protein AAGK23_06090 [Pseudomonadota bacterium]